MGAPLLDLMRTDFLAFVLVAISIIEAIALHEFAHAYVADLQGDRLPRAMGRLTLNPVRHLDPLGTICIVLLGFGWGKPVEFRPGALSSRRFGSAMVALAGPSMNLLLALVGGVVLGFVVRSGGGTIGGGALSPHIALFLLYFVTINVTLAVFNLLPLPPLDGSRLLTIFLPPRHQKILFFLDRYGFVILLVLVFFGGTAFLGRIITPVNEWILRVAGGI